MDKCEHIIGMLYDYENTKIITLPNLLEHIKREKDFADYQKQQNGYIIFNDRVCSMEDYCDKSKDSDLERFEYCPICGEKIDWEKIKEENKK